jgi:uncharacterized protein YbjT (DUF2867 family)
MIAITGATGHTGKRAAEALLQNGEQVRVIGRDAKKLEPLAKEGAELFVGDLADVTSMTNAFSSAAAAYLMIPPAMERDPFRAYQEQISDSYAAAVERAKVSHVVVLSSVGAWHAEKTGPIVGLHNLEQKLRRIAGLNALFLRPANFMENLLMSLEPLRSMGFLPGPSPANVSLPMIASQDIGAYAAKRLRARDFSGMSTQELLGPRDVTMKEAAGIIGAAIGSPKLGYMEVPFMMIEPALAKMGMPKSSASLMVEMWKAGNAGLLAPQEPRSEKNTTSTTLEQFVTEVFLPAYRNNSSQG